MAEGMTITGWDNMVARVTDLPNVARQRFRARAQLAASRIQADARARLIAQQKTDARSLVNDITVREYPDENLFAIISDAPSNQPANLPLWVEYGTVRMSAREYMRPARLAEATRYFNDLQAIADQLAKETFE